MSRWLCLTCLSLAGLAAACEAEPADLLDMPRVLAIQAEPPTITEDAPQTITALAFGLPDAEMRWAACDAAWDTSAEVACPSAEEDLGAGNPVTYTPTGGPRWLRLGSADEMLLPSVRRLSTSGSATNPVVSDVTIDGAPPGAPLAAGAAVDILLTVTADDGVSLGVTWYATAGEILPARSRVDEPVTLTTPETPGPFEVIAVVRDDGGGVGWTRLTLEVGP